MSAPQPANFRPRLLVVGYRKFSELVNSVVAEFDDMLDVTIVDSVASKTTSYDELVTQYQPDVLASAGANASYLATTTQLPVVSQPVTDADLVEALIKARKLSRRVHLFTYLAIQDSIPPLLNTLPELLDIELVWHRYSTSMEANEKLAIAHAEEAAKVVVGPSFTCHLAEGYGLPAILVYSKRSARELLRDALEQAHIEHEKRFQSAVRDILFDDPHEHLVMTDAQGLIVNFNDLASRQWDIKRRKAAELQRELGLDLNDSGGDRDRMVVIAGDTWYQRRHPIEVRGELLGYVFRYLPQYAYRPDQGDGSGQPNLEFIVRSEQMHELMRLARSYALTTGAVLIQGESGTGKEHVAREIYRSGVFADGNLVALNCGSIPSELFESELFGYVEGAFTNSRRGGHVGLIQRAEKGVLFLDEIAELPLDQQGKLLRVLQEKQIRPVGGAQEFKVDFKIVAATNRDLAQRVREGLFREDLYYRLNVFALQLPALRDRGEDIPAITRYYLQRFSRQYPVELDLEVLYGSVHTVFESYFWPGNVRELENYCERLVVNCLDAGSSEIDERRLRRLIPEFFSSEARPTDVPPSLKAQEEQAIIDAMERFSNDRPRVAEYLGISTTTLWRRLKAINVSRKVAGHE